MEFGKGVFYHEKNLSAEKTAKKKSTRLPEENGNRERPQGFGAQTRKRQSKTFSLNLLKSMVVPGFPAQQSFVLSFSEVKAFFIMKQEEKATLPPRRQRKNRNNNSMDAENRNKSVVGTKKYR